MKLKIPEYLTRLAPYVPGKPIEELERELGLSGSIKLASNENPLGPSPRAVEAALDEAARVHRYPDGSGYYLRQALSVRLGVDADQIILGSGSCELVELIARTFLEPSENAVISEGAFIMYRVAVQTANRGLRVVPQKNTYTHDTRAMAAAVDAATRIVFIANPNNPTGTYVDEEDLRFLLDRVPDDVLVIVDEAYIDYVAAADYPRTLLWLPSRPNLVLLRTFSKVYGLAGFRIGYALTSPPVAETLGRVRSPFNTSSISQAAARAALDDAGHLARSIESNRIEMAFLVDGFKGLGLNPVPSVANFVLVPIGPEASEIYDKMLHRGVIVRPMTGPWGFPHALRITVGTHTENERCLAALAHALGRPPASM